MAALLEKVQEEVLKMDDIDEFDSDNEDENNNQSSQQATNTSTSGNYSLSQQSKPPVKPINAPSAPLDTNGGNPTRAPTAVTQAPRPLKAVRIIANPYKTKPTKPAVAAKCGSFNRDPSSKNGGVLHVQDAKAQVAPIPRAFNNPYANKKGVSKPTTNQQTKTKPVKKSLPKSDEEEEDISGRTIIGNRVLMDV